MQEHPIASNAPPDENQLMQDRRDKLKALRVAQQDGKGVAFPNDFQPSNTAEQLFAAYDAHDANILAGMKVQVKVAGRMMLKRVMGKASFCTLQDASFGENAGRIQIYVKGEDVGADVYAAFKHWDLGDIVAAEGLIFKTRTGELSIHASSVRLLTKSLRPMPDKFHGIHDQEMKYRQRYLDLMTDAASRKRFVARSKAVSGIREFMVQHGFLEVETPMLHPIPGGCQRQTVQHPPQRPGPAHVFAHRPRVVSQAPAWWAALSGCSRSTATFATRASRYATTRNSP